MSSPRFIHLRVHSSYSLLEGAIGLKPLVKWCVGEKMPAVAITDHGNLFGSLEFAMAASGAGVQPIMGCVVFLEPYVKETGRAAHRQPPEQLLLYAQNETGWQNLLHLVSQSYLEPAGGIAPRLTYDQLKGHTEGIIALTGGIYGTLGRLLLAGQKEKAEEALRMLKELFPDRLYLELMRHGLQEEKLTEPEFVRMALSHDIPLIATNDAYFIGKKMYEAHDAFMCISEGAYVSEQKRRRLTPHHRLKKVEEMCELFSDIPEALENTVQLAKRCHFMAPSRAPILPNFTDEEGNTNADEMLRDQAREGLEERLRNHVFKEGMSDAEREEKAKPYRERLEYEIETIINMKFPGYFLIVSDFIKWSKSHNIPVGPGRGSGAGSLVAWSLSITDLDPLRFGLLFERFLNPERVSMPDFDVDFCQDRRDEVISYVQQRYGFDRVAQIITFGKLQARAVLRDVGRVLQMPYGQVDKICKMVPNNPANPVTLEEAIEMEPMFKAAIAEDESVDKLVTISLKLEGLKRHASTHAAGVVIADRPLSELVPMYRDPKSDMPVVQYSMKYAEAAGLVKFDFLGLKTLSVLSTAVDMVADRGIMLDLLKLPEGDKPTYELLGRGESVGVFQLESAGMRDTLRKLKPDTMEDIIALVSLYRPGPMDNIPTYIARKHREEKPNYLHPKLKPILKETFGVIIYQEQVMQIAQELAGYSLGEADLLRRAMGKKIASEMEAQRGIFTERAVEKGVPEREAKGIFDLIAKFASYGFNKSHAAAYALIAYQTAYLKANYPVEFLAATMTYDMHNTDKLGIFREEAAKFDIQLLPPNINKSDVYFSVEDGNIRYALSAVRNVGEAAMEAVVKERREGGEFTSIFDFVSRVPGQAINKRLLEYLIKAGAFDALHANRKQLVESLDMIVAYGETLQRDRESNQESLFAAAGSSAAPDVPNLPQCQPWPKLEQLSYEFEAIGFYLSAHPLDAYRSMLEAQGVVPTTLLPERLDTKYSSVKVAGIVTGRKFKVSDKGRFAFVQLSDAHGMVECSIFNEELLNKHRERLEPGHVLLVHADGKKDEFGVRLIAQNIADLDAEITTRAPGAKQVSVCIKVQRPEAINEIRTVLGQSNGVGMKVTLRAKTDEGEVMIRLPGGYAVTPAVFDKLNVIEGVEAAEEVA